MSTSEKEARLERALAAAEREVDLLQHAVMLYEDNALIRALRPGGNPEIAHAVDRAFARFGPDADADEIARGGPRGETDARASTGEG